MVRDSKPCGVLGELRLLSAALERDHVIQARGDQLADCLEEDVASLEMPMPAEVKDDRRVAGEAELGASLAAICIREKRQAIGIDGARPQKDAAVGATAPEHAVDDVLRRAQDRSHSAPERRELDDVSQAVDRRSREASSGRARSARPGAGGTLRAMRGRPMS